MKKTLIVIFCSLFFCSLLFSAYDENKFMQAGKEMIQKGQYDNAIKVFNFVIKKNPKNVQAIILGAFAHLKNGNKEAAKKYLTVAYNMTKDPRIKKQIDALSSQQPVQTAEKQIPEKQTYKSISAGLKAGINMANLSGEDVLENTEMVIGTCVGGYVSFSFHPWFSIQPEVLYSEKGVHTEQNLSTNYYIKSTLNLSYIEVPVLAKLSINTGSAFVPVIFAGPAVSFITNALKIHEITENKNTFRNVINAGEDVNSIDFGLVAGAGFEIKLGPGALMLEARYDMGLSNVYNIEGLPVEIDAKNTAITILAGYSF